MMIKERYSRNAETFSQEEMALIKEKKVCVIGCGGLGGHVIQSFVRFGIKEITIIDGDIFAKNNLNRQVFSSEVTLGSNKALVVQAALWDINSEVKVTAYPEMLTEDNAETILSGQDIVIDCLDNIATRHIIAKYCTNLEIPLVHGAIGGFYGQVANIFPADGMMDYIYKKEHEEGGGIEKRLGNPPFMPQLVAAIQCSEGLKILSGRSEVLRNELLHIDLLHNNFETIKFAIGEK